MNGDNVTYFDSFEVKHIPKKKKIKKFISNKNAKTNNYRMQAKDSIICGCFYILFIDFMSKGKNLFDYTNLNSPNEYERNNKIILKYFKQLEKLRWKKIYCVEFKKYKKFKNPKISYFYKKLVISIICGKCGSKRKIIFTKKNQFKY